jgi:apolipoprotein N-acyltransferase
MGDNPSKPRRSSLDSIGGCLGVFITLALVVLLGGGAFTSLREDGRSRTGWFLAVLSIAFLLPLVFRKRHDPRDPEVVEERRRSARILQQLGWIQSGFQDSRAPEEIPPKPGEAAEQAKDRGEP